MWERELKLIENLKKLYPNNAKIIFQTFRQNNNTKSTWIYFLCLDHLRQRLPRLEKFIKENNKTTWKMYKDYFNITDEQCGKEK